MWLLAVALRSAGRTVDREVGAKALAAAAGSSHAGALKALLAAGAGEGEGALGAALAQAAKACHPMAVRMLLDAAGDGGGGGRLSVADVARALEVVATGPGSGLAGAEVGDMLRQWLAGRQGAE